MEWMIPAISFCFLTIVAVFLFLRKNKPPEVNAVFYAALSLMIYHFGDMGMWAGWNYELFRRIASIGYYLEIPAFIYLAYICLPQEKRTLLTRVFSFVLCVPWLIAVLLIKSTPNNFLEYPNIPLGVDSGKNENFVMTMILCFSIGVIFVAITAFRAARVRKSAAGSLSRTIAWATIVMLISEFVLFAMVETLHYDSTYLFGFISIFWISWVGMKANCYLKELKKQQ